MKNRSLSRRDFLYLSAGAAAGSLLAACGQAATPQVIKETVEVEKVVTKEVEKIVTKEVEKEVEKVVTATPPPREPVTIRFIATAPEQYYNIDAFNEQNKFGITAEFEDIGDESFEAVLLTSVAGGNPAELAWASGVKLWRYAQAGAVMDITPLMEASPHAELDQIAPIAIAQYNSPGYFPKGQVLMAPGQYGWPVYATAYVMIYNKRMLDDAGVDYPERGWTWDDFRAILQAVNDPAKKVWGFVMPSSATGDSTIFAHNMLWTNGGDVYDAGGKCALASPQAAEALQFLQDLVTKDKTVLLGGATEGVDFLGGNVAFQYWGMWVIGWYDSAMTDPYSIVTVPKKTDEAVWGGIDGFAFLNGSANPWAGWELAKWLSSYEYEGGPGGQKVLNDEDQVEVISVNAKARAEAYVNANFDVPKEAKPWFPGWLFDHVRYDPWIPTGPGFNYWTAYDGIWAGDSVQDTLETIDSLNASAMKFG
jgi:ABC-type glycerol-3-phosphate transport system substrate-binding protein